MEKKKQPNSANVSDRYDHVVHHAIYEQRDQFGNTSNR